jgi:glycosyltransferase involved in cell wall biosynthesis
MPSDFEGMARVYLEAQACGRALLASDIPAASEVIEDGLTGILYRRGDINELAKKIAILARDPIQRQTLGENARKQIEERHSLDQIAAEYNHALSSVVEKARRS